MTADVEGGVALSYLLLAVEKDRSEETKIHGVQEAGDITNNAANKVEE